MATNVTTECFSCDAREHYCFELGCDDGHPMVSFSVDLTTPWSYRPRGSKERRDHDEGIHTVRATGVNSLKTGRQQHARQHKDMLLTAEHVRRLWGVGTTRLVDTRRDKESRTDVVLMAQG